MFQMYQAVSHFHAALTSDWKRKAMSAGHFSWQLPYFLDGLINLVTLISWGYQEYWQHQQKHELAFSLQPAVFLFDAFVCIYKEQSGAKETRYGHYWRRRLTIVANLQATVSARSEDQGSSSSSLCPQPPARLRGHKSAHNHTANVQTIEKCCKSSGIFLFMNNDTKRFLLTPAFEGIEHLKSGLPTRLRCAANLWAALVWSRALNPVNVSNIRGYTASLLL